MYKRISLFIFIAIFIFSSVSLAQTRRLRLKVKDTDGKPIEGVNITLTTPEKDNYKKVVSTNKKGQTTLLLHMEIKNVNFLLEKDGYQNLQDSKELRRIRPSQELLYYEHSFLLYRTDELSPEQKIQQYKASQEAHSFFNKGMELFQVEDFSGAVGQFKKAVETKPDFFEAYQNLAAAYFQAELYQEAIEAAKKVLEIKPDTAQTLKLISVSYSRLGDEKTALEYQDKLKELSDAEFSPEEIFNMGAVAANEGRDEEAAEYFRKVTEMKPDFALAYYQLGLTYFRLKYMEAAKTFLEKYLELDPEGENAKTAKTLLQHINKSQ